MGKLTLQDLAAVLVEKNALDKEEARKFVAAIFDVIRDGVEKDKLVKVKGLGTFKIIEVEDRESVNVNTGERVLIDGHSKISFTPDSTMKELVNKPFASFETVALNDGVEFEDTPTPGVNTESKPVKVEEQSKKAPKVVAEQPKEETAKNSEKTQVETPEVMVEEAKIEAPKNVDQPKEETLINVDQPKEETLINVEQPKEEPVKVVQKAEAKVENEPVKVVEQPVEESVDEKVVPEKKGTLKYIIIAVLCLAIGVVLGFALNKLHLFESSSQESNQAEAPAPVTADSLDKISKDTAAVAVISDSLNAGEKGQDSIAIQKPVETPVVPSAEAEPEYKKYDAKDVRVRLGAYYIAGFDKEVEAREGDNIARVSRRYFGEGMSCYVEVYNDMSAKTVLKAGQKVKLPKLRLRKYLKKKNN